MECIHCNACGWFPIPSAHQDIRRIYITSCFHMLCHACVANGKDTCLVCKTNCRCLEINPNMKQEIKMYFMDPMNLLRDFMKKAAAVMEFQKNQAKRFQMVTTSLMEFQRKGAIEKQTLLEKVNTLEQEKLQMQRKMDLMEQAQQSWIGQGRGLNGIAIATSTTTTGYDAGSFFDTTGRVGGGVFQTPAQNQSSRMPISNPASATGSFFIQNRQRTTPSMFGQTPPDRELQTPDGRWTPEDRIAPGRLTLNRTPNTEEEMTPVRQRFQSPNFCPAPGSGRPQRQDAVRINNESNQTPSADIASRLRQLRCTAATPKPGQY